MDKKRLGDILREILNTKQQELEATAIKEDEIKKIIAMVGEGITPCIFCRTIINLADPSTIAGKEEISQTEGLMEFDMYICEKCARSKSVTSGFIRKNGEFIHKGN